jgi:septal ring factor EnvC (AmiA/AmiB activator)
MPKQKTIAELNAEKEKIEQQLTQEQHKKQRLENRIAYYERGDRTKRAHNLIVRGADNSEVTALSIAGIRVPEMKKSIQHLYCVLHQIHIHQR